MGWIKRSRFTPKMHQDKVISAFIGPSAILELPPPPQKLVRSNTERCERILRKYEKVQKEKLLEGDSDEDTSTKKAMQN